MAVLHHPDGERPCGVKPTRATYTCQSQDPLSRGGLVPFENTVPYRNTVPRWTSNGDDVGVVSVFTQIALHPVLRARPSRWRTDPCSIWTTHSSTAPSAHSAGTGCPARQARPCVSSFWVVAGAPKSPGTDDAGVQVPLGSVLYGPMDTRAGRTGGDMVMHRRTKGSVMHRRRRGPGAHGMLLVVTVLLFGLVACTSSAPPPPAKSSSAATSSSSGTAAAPGAPVWPTDQSRNPVQAHPARRVEVADRGSDQGSYDQRHSGKR